MKNYFIGAVLVGAMFTVAPATTQAAGLTQVQIQAVLSLLQAFGAEPVVIENASKAMGLMVASSTTPTEQTIGPKFSVKEVKASTFASTTTSVHDFCLPLASKKCTIPTQTKTLGVYTLSLQITAGDKAVYIPMTTTDSTQGRTGVAYSLKGQDFRGGQYSTFSCPGSTGICRITPGQTKSVGVTVQLNPNEVGNYGVSFDKLNYTLGKDGEVRIWRIDAETEVIYIK